MWGDLGGIQLGEVRVVVEGEEGEGIEVVVGGDGVEIEEEVEA